MVKEIRLSQGKVAAVDDEDFEYLNQWKWWYSDGCAKKSVYMNGKRKPAGAYMHRLIMNTPPGMDTDHINGNSLDNRRCNLRVCTHAENLRNKAKTKGTSKYKGVHWHKADNKWRAQIGVDWGKLHLGNFHTEEEAALAYNEAALKHFGEFARLNALDKKEV